MQVSSNRLLGMPTIGALFARPRLWAWRRARRGAFGPLTTTAGDLHATLAGVERYHGCSFSAEQLRAAGVLDPSEATHGQT